MLLALDTSSAAVTVAVHDGRRILAEHATVDPLAHGELLAPAVQQVVRDAGIDISDVTKIAVGTGPGPFTGLRVGIVTARTLAHVLGVEAVGCCSLDVIAAEVVQHRRAGAFQVATDARRKEVYVATYASDGVRTDGPRVVRPADTDHALPTAGRGTALYPAEFTEVLGPAYPSAGVLATSVLTGSVAVTSTEPLYLRRPHVAKPAGGQRQT